MWNNSNKDEKMEIETAVNYIEDTEKFGGDMIRVVNEWKFSCEHNLTDRSQNRRAWIGQAAAALAYNYSADFTKTAWNMTDKQKQEDANKVADIAISLWEKKHLEGLCQK